MSADLQRVLVLDLATLRYRFAANRRSLSVLTASGETLASVTMRPAEEDTDVIFRAVGEAGRTSCVLRADEHGNVTAHTLAFYNPYTTQVSWNAGPHPVLFAGPAPIALASDGTTAVVHAQPGEHVLSVGDCELAEFVPDSSTVARTLSAYR